MPLRDVPHPLVATGGSFQTALIAARIARVLAPSTALNIGEHNELAIALGEVGVAAEHVAIPAAMGSVVQLPAGRWDVVTCLGVLEKLPPDHAEALVEQLSMVTDQVIVSCGPATYFAPTTVTVRPAPAWAAAFAERGLFRRAELDLEFAGPWTVVFERGTPSARDLVYRYEQALAAAMADISDRSAAGHTAAVAEDGTSAADLQTRIAGLRHELLVSRDHAIGQEAELAHLKAESEKLHARLNEVYASTTWRLGTMAVRPVGRLKRAVGPR